MLSWQVMSSYSLSSCRRTIRDTCRCAMSRAPPISYSIPVHFLFVSLYCAFLLVLATSASKTSVSFDWYDLFEWLCIGRQHRCRAPTQQRLANDVPLSLDSSLIPSHESSTFHGESINPKWYPVHVTRTYNFIFLFFSQFFGNRWLNSGNIRLILHRLTDLSST